jgi:3-hydroxyacyl-CoA dehydrogenase/enoyl-CoA hydratase/3-hydroxybutyryl-CoA epimerase
VRLGLHPALGGIQRLLRTIDPLPGMDMMLGGKSIHAKGAKEFGLVDEIVEERHVRNAVRAAIFGGLHKRPRLRRQVQSPIFAGQASRKLAADRMRSETEKRISPLHYPAPIALIDLWEKYGDELPRATEIESFASLLKTETARNLLRVFRLREKLKAFADIGTIDGLRRVHVIGAGAMGGDIAAWCAWKGFQVSLADTDPPALAAAIKRAGDLYEDMQASSREARDALDRLIPDFAGAGASSADIVIEAAPERMDVKKRIYAALEQKMKPEAILATNTSSLPLTTLTVGLKRPERFIGVHFFTPVSRMELVELVRHPRVEEEVARQACAFLGEIERLPAPVRDAPGFLVNRALAPYMLEAMVLIQAGWAKETVDAAALAFGMPAGPVELADRVGLDICADVVDSLRRNLDRPLPDIPAWLRQKIEKGALGKKTGAGFYEWRNGAPVRDRDAPPPSPAMTDRLILPMIDACVECLRKGVVAEEDIADAAMVYGAGFAPFRGGPLHYARTEGIERVQGRLRELAATEGERFRPDPGWDALV